MSPDSRGREGGRALEPLAGAGETTSSSLRVTLLDPTRTRCACCGESKTILQACLEIPISQQRRSLSDDLCERAMEKW